jgi:hypothetical protein
MHMIAPQITIKRVELVIMIGNVRETYRSGGDDHIEKESLESLAAEDSALRLDRPEGAATLLRCFPKKTNRPILEPNADADWLLARRDWTSARGAYPSVR